MKLYKAFLILKCIMDIAFLDYKTLTIQDKFTLSCLDRIEKLESHYDDRIKKLEQTFIEYKKEILIKTIMCITDKSSIYIDVFAFLLGMKKDNVSSNSDFLSTFKNIMLIPARIIELHSHIKDIPFWDELFILSNFTHGTNMYFVLENMTLEELENYWKYRIEWTQWKV